MPWSGNYAPDGGGANTVAASSDTGEVAQTGIGGLFGATTKKAQGPNAAAYDAERNDANARANYLQNLANDYRQGAPTIANQFQGQSRTGIATNIGAQQALADRLAANQGEASKAQFQGHLDQGIAAQMAAANSVRGGSVAAAGAARAAAQQGGMMQAQGAAQAAALGFQERLAAQQAAAGVYGNIGGQLQSQYGLEQMSAVEQARLASINQAQVNQMKLGYTGLASQSDAQSLDALNAYTQGNLGAQGVTAAMNAANSAATNQIVGTAAGVGGTLLAGPAGGAVASGAVGGGAAPTGAGSDDILNRASWETYGGSNTKSDANAKTNISALYAEPSLAMGRPVARQASLSDALAGIEHLKARLANQSR